MVYDEADPDPNRRYKLAWPDVWHGADGHQECTSGFAVSPDGVHWTESKSPGLPSSDEWGLSLDREGGLFVHYVKFHDPQYNYRA